MQNMSSMLFNTYILLYNTLNLLSSTIMNTSLRFFFWLKSVYHHFQPLVEHHEVYLQTSWMVVLAEM
jgi:hypothetical protein